MWSLNEGVKPSEHKSIIIACKKRQKPKTEILSLCSTGTAKFPDHQSTYMWQKESFY